MTTAGSVAEGDPGDASPDLPGARQRRGRRDRGHRHRRRRHRGRRLAAWLAITCLVVVAGATEAYVLTPSVSTAGALAREQEARHHVSDTAAAVPQRFAAALIATEDHRFYSEPGIDPIALARAAKGAVTRHADGGGSTLSVQLAKMLYTPENDGLPAKAEQAVLAVKLNLRYSKARILRMYANVVYFGGGYYGLSAASCGFFGVAPGALSWGQAAVLAGLVQAPAAYDPRLHLDLARQRAQHVLDRLVATGQIPARQARAALAAPLHLTAAGPPAGCR